MHTGIPRRDATAVTKGTKTGVTKYVKHLRDHLLPAIAHSPHRNVSALSLSITQRASKHYHSCKYWVEGPDYEPLCTEMHEK